MTKINFKKLFIGLLLIGLLVFGNIYLLFESREGNAYAIEQQCKKWEYSDCENVIKFIDDNFELFINEYNKTVAEEEMLLAESIEYSSIIWLVEDNNYGAYIDFNGENGYIVITGDYNIYDLQVEGDFECLREINELYYSFLDGFLYKDENGIFQKVIEQGVAEAANSFEIVWKDGDGADAAGNIYTGQDKPGDGEINPKDISQYVKERYSNYKFVSSVTDLSAGFNYSRQYKTSYYIKSITDKDGNSIGSTTWSEGNCVLNSLYMALCSWQSKGFVNNLPTGTVNLYSTITSDPLYDYYGQGIVREGESGGKAKSGSSNGDTGAKYHKWETSYSNLSNMPVLYRDIRDYAVNKYGYTPESNFKFDNVPSVGAYVANTLYNNNISIKKSSSVTSALNNISSKAVFLGINNSSTYGNHGVVIVGYYKYSYTTGWWIFSSTKYAYFYEIADGWNTSSRIFDPNTSASPSMWAYYLV